MGGWFEANNPADEQESYGRHNRYRMFAVPVAVLLQEALDEGRALRLRWRRSDEASVDDTSREFPTGVMQAVRRDGY